MVIHSSNSWNQIAETFLSAPDLRYALVTLVAKDGSSYLKPGARLLVCEDGRYWGEISAGCLEVKVSARAVDSIRRGEHQLINIDTRPLYGCFGTITLLVEVIQDADRFSNLMQQLRRARERRESIRIATDFTDLTATRLTIAEAARGRCETCMVEQIDPPVQFLVLGDWPDGRSTAEIGKRMGWQTFVYDASAPMFSIERTLRQHQIDTQTAVLIATHNLARDAGFLEQVLRFHFGYIGVIGSRKRRMELARLIGDYNDFELIERFEQVCCPAGLDLGGEGARSVALSVVAGIQAQLNGRSAQPLCQRNSPIHMEEPAL